MFVQIVGRVQSSDGHTVSGATIFEATSGTQIATTDGTGYFSTYYDNGNPTPPQSITINIQWNPGANTISKQATAPVNAFPDPSGRSNFKADFGVINMGMGWQQATSTCPICCNDGEYHDARTDRCIKANTQGCPDCISQGYYPHCDSCCPAPPQCPPQTQCAYDQKSIVAGWVGGILVGGALAAILIYTLKPKL